LRHAFSQDELLLIEDHLWVVTSIVHDRENDKAIVVLMDAEYVAEYKKGNA